MASFNRVILMGNLTRDPQLKYLPTQTPVVEFGLATNRKFRTSSGEMREEVCFIECSAFGKQAEIINQYCQKGRPLLVEGRLKFDTWEDRNGGGKRSKHTVVIDNFQLLGGRDGAPGGGGYQSAPQQQQGYQSAPQQGYQSGPQQSAPPRQAMPQQPQEPVEQPFGEEQQFNDNDIPF